MSTPFYNNIIFFQITVFYVPAVSRRIRSLALLSAVSEHLSSRNTDFLFRDLLSEKVAQAVSLQSLAPQPLIST